MSILFGHPSGNPNSHHAALAHFEAGRLEAFCLPWMPTPRQIRYLSAIPNLRNWVTRLERRCFQPLLDAPRIEGQSGEWWRMVRRVVTPLMVDDGLSYRANDWLMRTMAQECARPHVTAIHAYEDCSLLQFVQARRLGKACIYDMPIGFYPAWEEKEGLLERQFAEWLPPSGLPSRRHVRPEQKRKEMELADLVLAPSTFVMDTIRPFYPDKQLVLAPYGVDSEFWRPQEAPRADGPLRFIYAGQISIRKGIPLLLEAWRKAGIKNAHLELVGSWHLSMTRKQGLPNRVTISGACPPEALRARYQASDVFVFPSYFEGFGLVLLEAMACGLPVITTNATAGIDILNSEAGQIVEAGSVDELVESLRWFATNQDRLPLMRKAARVQSEAFTWEQYRRIVSQAVGPFVK